MAEFPENRGEQGIDFPSDPRNSSKTLMAYKSRSIRHVVNPE
jgi:hypothetical protein